jgi:predicted ABC-type ATPase
MSLPTPVMYVFAGNNGSGKSTIRNLIIDRLGVSVNIDSDAIARRIDSRNPENHRVSARKETIRLARDCIANNRDFSIETTLAGGNVIRQMQDARKKGFKIMMFYVGLGDPQLNIERVAARVRNGGHYIASEDILKRHITSIQNLIAHLEQIDHLVVIDNSQIDGEIVLEAERVIKYEKNPLPNWVIPIENMINSRANF